MFGILVCEGTLLALVQLLIHEAPSSPPPQRLPSVRISHYLGLPLPRCTILYLDLFPIRVLWESGILHSSLVMQ